jgi:tRNA wybutosine-synthesizing protein 1
MDEKFINEYSRLDKKASPLFIEPKGYVFVGYSRQRMNLANMPSHEKIKSFSKNLSENLGYNLTLERSDSRVVLLSKKEKTERFDK